MPARTIRIEDSVDGAEPAFAGGSETCGIYDKALKNLVRLSRIADRTTVVDNTGEAPDVICEIADGSASVIPNQYWSKEDILCLLTVR